MIETFSFRCPDGSFRIVDLNSVFTTRPSSNDFRKLGESIVSLHPEACAQLAEELNAAHRASTGSQELWLDPAVAVDRIGNTLGTRIFDHVRRDEPTADVWAEAREILLAKARGTDLPRIYVV